MTFAKTGAGLAADGYCSDITRTVVFGKPTKRQIDVWVRMTLRREGWIFRLPAVQRSSGARLRSRC